MFCIFHSISLHENEITVKHETVLGLYKIIFLQMLLFLIILIIVFILIEHFYWVKWLPLIQWKYGAWWHYKFTKFPLSTLEIDTKITTNFILCQWDMFTFLSLAKNRYSQSQKYYLLTYLLTWYGNINQTAQIIASAAQYTDGYSHSCLTS